MDDVIVIKMAGKLRKLSQLGVAMQTSVVSLDSVQVVVTLVCEMHENHSREDGLAG